MQKKCIIAISAHFPLSMPLKLLRKSERLISLANQMQKKNAKTIARYSGFFTPSQEALRVYFFLELAKMFDSSKKALHIYKILNHCALKRTDSNWSRPEGREPMSC